MATMRAAVVALVVVLGLAGRAAGFAINVDAHDEECFHDTVKVGTKMGLSFQVAEGGFLDIDVKIVGPDNKIIYSGERETDGKYTFSAHMDGRYEYCFSNKMSTVTDKLVVFNMVIGSTQPAKADDSETHDKLHDLVEELDEAIHGVKREQEYMEVRERTHRLINDSTNSRVVWWSVFEALVLVAMSVGQVYYLHRFFEVRTTV